MERRIRRARRAADDRAARLNRVNRKPRRRAAPSLSARSISPLRRHLVPSATAHLRDHLSPMQHVRLEAGESGRSDGRGDVGRQNAVGRFRGACASSPPASSASAWARGRGDGRAVGGRPHTAREPSFSPPPLSLTTPAARLLLLSLVAVGPVLERTTATVRLKNVYAGCVPGRVAQSASPPVVAANEA